MNENKRMNQEYTVTASGVATTLQPMRNWLNTTSGHFGAMVKKAWTIHKLNDVLRRVLPPKMHAHCRVANFREHKLMLQIDAPTWATQIIYALPDVLTHFQKSCPDLRFVQVDYFVEPFFFKDETDE